MNLTLRKSCLAAIPGIMGIGTGGAMAPTEFLKYILAPPLLPAFTKLFITYATNAINKCTCAINKLHTAC